MSTPETAATIWELVEARAVASPDAIALIDESDTRISCAELRDEALRTAAGLAEMGVGENTPVTWQLPTTIDAIVISLALARLGAAGALIAPRRYRSPIDSNLRLFDKR